MRDLGERKRARKGVGVGTVEPGDEFAYMTREALPSLWQYLRLF
jgi:hypothetical protein